MQVGVISDIHGNLVALEAVLDDMPDVDDIICVGDIVGYNPWPAKCVDRVREVAGTSVIGNHGLTLLSGYEKYRANPSAYQGLALADDRLTANQREWLSNLPEVTTAADGQILVSHAHPHPDKRWTTKGYVKPRHFPEMSPYLRGVDPSDLDLTDVDDPETYREGFDFLVTGHTHVQHGLDLSKFDSEGTVVNPGSVGQPRDKNPKAAYAVLDIDANTYDLRRVDYDIAAVQEEIAELGLPPKTRNRLEKGK